MAAVETEETRVPPKVYVPTGKPRGRRPGVEGPKVYVPTGKPRGRRPGVKDEFRYLNICRVPGGVKKKTKPNNRMKSEYVPVYKQAGGENEKRGAHLRKGMPRGLGRPKKPEDVPEETTDSDSDSDKVYSDSDSDADSDKVYVPTGKPRGKQPGVKGPKVYVPTGKPRGRRPGVKKTKPNNSLKVYYPMKSEYVPVYKQAGGENEKRGAHLRKGMPRRLGHPKKPEDVPEETTDSDSASDKVYVPTGKPRGRQPGVKGPKVYVPTGKPRGRRPGIKKTKPNNSLKVYYPMKHEYVPVYKKAGGENEKRGAHLRKPDHLKVANIREVEEV